MVLYKNLTKSQRGAQRFASAASSILRKVRGGFEDQVYFGDQILERFEFVATIAHKHTVRRRAED